MASVPSDAAVNQLLDMGFPLERIKVALATSNNDVNEAMEWLLVHSGDDAVPESAAVTAEVPREDGGNDPRGPVHTSSEPAGEPQPVPKGEDEQMALDQQEDGAAADGETAKTLKCDECGKLFKTTEEAEFHAAKTQHTAFSESTEEKKPLTEEERKEQMEKLQERLKQRRLEREQKEKEEALNREKNRIKMGKEYSEVRRKQEEMEMKKIAEERKREKMEEKLARQRVLDQIARDKEARMLKQKGGVVDAAPPPQPPVPVPQAVPSGEKKVYDKTRLQLRLPSGRVLTETFGVKEPLASVRLYVANNSGELVNPANISLMTNFPKKVYGSEDWETPLEALDLVPSAVLFVKFT